MEKDQFIAKLQQLIKKQDINLFFRELDQFEILDKEISKDIILLLARHTNLARNESRALISNEDYTRQYLKLISDLLKLIEKLKDETVEIFPRKEILSTDPLSKNVDASDLEKALRTKLKPLQDQLLQMKRSSENLEGVLDPMDARRIHTDMLQALWLSHMKFDYIGDADHFKNCKIKIDHEIYTLLKQLGAGKYGEVWEARTNLNANHEKVAIKILHPGHYDDEVISFQFFSGAKCQHGLTHPNIVKALEPPYDDKQSKIKFVVMELVKGSNLRSFVLRENSDFNAKSYSEFLKRIFKDLCAAIQELHDHENVIIHRDICPSNILISEDHTAHLTDFDNVNLMGAKGGTNRLTNLGTFPYIPPEVKSESENKQSVKEKIAVGIKSDLYSLTLVLLFCLKKRPLQEIKFIQQLDDKGWHGLIDDKNFTYRQQVKKFLKKGTAANPDQRFNDIKEFKQAFEKLNLRGLSKFRIYWNRYAVFVMAIFLLLFSAISTIKYVGWANDTKEELNKMEIWYTADSVSKLDSVSKIFSNTSSPFRKFVKQMAIAVLDGQDRNSSVLKTDDYFQLDTENLGLFDLEKDSNCYALNKHYYHNASARISMTYEHKDAFFPSRDTVGFRNFLEQCSTGDSAIIEDTSVLSIFASLANLLVQKTQNIERTYGQSHEMDSLLVSKLLEIPENQNMALIPNLIFVGYQPPGYRSTTIDPCYHFRYPPYEISDEKLLEYNPTKRPWWESANDEEWTITLDSDILKFDSTSYNLSYGLCKPYKGARQKQQPNRAFWCKMEEDKADGKIFVLGIDFIYKPEITNWWDKILNFSY